MSNAIRRRPSVRLEVEPLEDRCTPAQFGVPWTDPLHLTLSFVPDGTALTGAPSNLNAALDGQMAHAAWQGVVLRAFQAWASVANINLGVVADDGSAFG